MKRKIKDQKVTCPSCGLIEDFWGMLVCAPCFRKGKTVRLISVEMKYLGDGLYSGTLSESDTSELGKLAVDFKK